MRLSTDAETIRKSYSIQCQAADQELRISLFLHSGTNPRFQRRVLSPLAEISLK